MKALFLFSMIEEDHGRIWCYQNRLSAFHTDSFQMFLYKKSIMRKEEISWRLCISNGVNSQIFVEKNTVNFKIYSEEAQFVCWHGHSMGMESLDYSLALCKWTGTNQSVWFHGHSYNKLKEIRQVHTERSQFRPRWVLKNCFNFFSFSSKFTKTLFQRNKSCIKLQHDYVYKDHKKH